MSDDRVVRIGVVGLGYWGPNLARNIIACERAELTWACDLRTELETKYPPLAIVSYSWLGDAYSPAGEVLTRPEVTISGGLIRIAAPVYGTLMVNYSVLRHLYTLDTPLRPEAVENAAQSHLYACWDGGNTVLAIKQPDGAEEGACNYDVTYLMPDFIDNRQPPDHVDPEDVTVEVDYCTGQEISG